MARKPTNTLVEELYLINNSPYTIDKVYINNQAKTPSDDVTQLKSDLKYGYENIQPGEAVKVDEYDNYYDLD